MPSKKKSRRKSQQSLRCTSCYFVQLVLKKEKEKKREEDTKTCFKKLTQRGWSVCVCVCSRQEGSRVFASRALVVA